MTTSVAQLPPLLVLPYDILLQIADDALSIPPYITFRCPKRHDVYLSGSWRLHEHPSCGHGPGWACLVTPPTPPLLSSLSLEPQSQNANPSKDLSILHTHSLLHEPARRALLSRRFEIEIRRGTVFFADWVDEAATARLAEFDFSLARRVQITIWPSPSGRNGASCLKEVVDALMETKYNKSQGLRELTVLIMDTLGEDWGDVTGEDVMRVVDGCKLVPAENARERAQQEVVEFDCAARQARSLTEAVGKLRGVKKASVGLARVVVKEGPDGFGQATVEPWVWELEPGREEGNGPCIDFEEWEWLYLHLMIRMERRY